MNRDSIRRRLRLFGIAGTILASAAPALADTQDFIDLEAGAGYSSNPLLRLNARSAAFGRVSAYAEHWVRTERGSTVFSAYVENTSYLRDYGSKQIFDLHANTKQGLSPNVSVWGTLDFSGDFAGQLSSRLIPGPPPVVDPGNPPPPNNNPDVFGLVGRQYRITGQAGASIRTSAKGTLSFSAGAEHLMFSGHNSPADYSVYFGNIGYDHTVSERTSIGGAVYLQHQDFAGDNYANVINPVVRVHTQLSESVTADAAVGLFSVSQHRNGETDRSTTPSFSGSICQSTENTRLCGRVSRDARSALANAIPNGSGQSAITTEASIDYYHRLGRDDTIQASILGVRYSSPSTVNSDRFHTTYASAVFGLDHKIGHRLSTGFSAGARKVYQTGPDPKVDVTGSVYLRYHIGDLL